MRKKRRRPAMDERHYLAIALLTEVPTPTLDSIARACTVDRRTLYRWRLRSDFERELRKAQERKADAMFRAMKETVPLRSVADIEWFFNATGYATQ